MFSDVRCNKTTKFSRFVSNSNVKAGSTTPTVLNNRIVVSPAPETVAGNRPFEATDSKDVRETLRKQNKFFPAVSTALNTNGLSYGKTPTKPPLVNREGLQTGNTDSVAGNPRHLTPVAGHVKKVDCRVESTTSNAALETPKSVDAPRGRTVAQTEPLIRSRSVSKGRSSSPTVEERRRSVMTLTSKMPTPKTPLRRIRLSTTAHKIVVGVRLRPCIEKDEFATQDEPEVAQVVNEESPKVRLTIADRVYEFDYDHIFESNKEKLNDQQRRVYEDICKPLVQSLLDGYNCSFLAYGQTGSGKTFSTTGTVEYPGVVPRFCQDLLSRLNSTKVGADKNIDTCQLELSYYEIYNEKIIDLLATKEQRQHVTLRVREHKIEGPYVENLLSIPVLNFADIQKWILLGNCARTKASTHRNDESSRSHAILVLKLQQTKMIDVNGKQQPSLRLSTVSFVDLAGSERMISGVVSKAERVTETKNINKSLSCLGTVILQLSEGKAHINYRDSILTWLLKESIGGNSKTVVLATVAPFNDYADETLSTLRYASRVMKIVNQTHVNEDPALVFIEKLKAENAMLKAGRPPVVVDKYSSEEDLESLKQLLQQVQKEFEEQKLHYEMKLKEVQTYCMTLEKEKTENGCAILSGQVSLANRKEPMLILLTADPAFSETMFFILKREENIVGRSDKCDIKLSEGASIQDIHCKIRWKDNLLHLHHYAGAGVYVNGHQVDDPSTENPVQGAKRLNDGDRLVLGTSGDYYFRVFVPNKTDKERKSSINTGATYVQAHSEFFAERYKRMEEELRRKYAAEQALFEDERMRLLLETEMKIKQEQQAYNDRIEYLQKSQLESNIARRRQIIAETVDLNESLNEAQRFCSSLINEIAEYSRQIGFPVGEPSSIEEAKTEAKRRRTLVETELAVNEANNMLRDWKKDFTFSFEQTHNQAAGEMQWMIRLCNDKLGLVTWMSVEEFLHRLETLRNLYRSGVRTATDRQHKFDSVLMNPKDDWHALGRSHSGKQRESNLMPLVLANTLRNVAGKNGETAFDSPPTSSSNRRNSILPALIRGRASFLMDIAEHPHAEVFAQIEEFLLSKTKTTSDNRFFDCQWSDNPTSVGNLCLTQTLEALRLLDNLQKQTIVQTKPHQMLDLCRICTAVQVYFDLAVNSSQQNLTNIIPVMDLDTTSQLAFLTNAYRKYSEELKNDTIQRLMSKLETVIEWIAQYMFLTNDSCHQLVKKCPSCSLTAKQAVLIIRGCFSGYKRRRHALEHDIERSNLPVTLQNQIIRLNEVLAEVARSQIKPIFDASAEVDSIEYDLYSLVIVGILQRFYNGFIFNNHKLDISTARTMCDEILTNVQESEIEARKEILSSASSLKKLLK